MREGNENILEMEGTPVLTLEPFMEETKKEVKKGKEDSLLEVQEVVLTPEEEKMVEDFAEKIDLSNSNMILKYGAGAQKKIADFSETALGNVRTKDLGEIGEMLTDVVTELKNFDTDEEEKGILGFFKRNSNKLGAMKARYAQAANDMASLCNRFEKKIHDLELTRMISLQMAPQIRMIQSNDTMMSEKIQTTVVNTIPLWKSQMVLAIGITHSQQAARAQREVTDMTNELLKKNAQILKVATIESAKESERGVVDIETLKMTNESLISTLDEVLKIQTEGREKRRNAEMELGRIEGELKQKLLDISKG